MRDDAGNRHVQSFVDADCGRATVNQRIDELMSQKGVRTVVAAVVAERFREHLRLPPFRLFIGFVYRERSGEAGVVLFDLIRGTPNDRAKPVGMRIEETHLIANPLSSFCAPDRRIPVDAYPERVTVLGGEEG